MHPASITVPVVIADTGKRGSSVMLMGHSFRVVAIVENRFYPAGMSLPPEKQAA